MKTCEHCGVEIDDKLSRCPLCGRRLEDGVAEAEDREPPAEATVTHARFWLWEVISLLAFASALVTFAADFAFGFEVTWSRYPLIALGYLWLAATALIALAKRTVLLVVAETSALALFLFGLERLSVGDAGAGGTGWFLAIGLPVTMLTAVVAALAGTVIAKLKLSKLPAIGVIILAAGIFVVGIEIVIRRYNGDEALVSWSLVAFACTIAVFLLILWINRRLRERHSEYRRVFHI